jgi:hypothetical protein
MKRDGAFDLALGIVAGIARVDAARHVGQIRGEASTVCSMTIRYLMVRACDSTTMTTLSPTFSQPF